MGGEAFQQGDVFELHFDAFDFYPALLVAAFLYFRFRHCHFACPLLYLGLEAAATAPSWFYQLIGVSPASIKIKTKMRI
nr:MAG TPA: hypothetical protein [Caudoviricetes sp.]